MWSPVTSTSNCSGLGEYLNTSGGETCFNNSKASSKALAHSIIASLWWKQLGQGASSWHGQSVTEQETFMHVMYWCTAFKADFHWGTARHDSARRQRETVSIQIQAQLALRGTACFAWRLHGKDFLHWHKLVVTRCMLSFCWSNKYCTMSVYGKSRALLRLSVFLLYKRLQKKRRKRRYWVHPIFQKRMSTRESKHILSFSCLY